MTSLALVPLAPSSDCGSTRVRASLCLNYWNLWLNEEKKRQVYTLICPSRSSWPHPLHWQCLLGALFLGESWDCVHIWMNECWGSISNVCSGWRIRRNRPETQVLQTTCPGLWIYPISEEVTLKMLVSDTRHQKRGSGSMEVPKELFHMGSDGFEIPFARFVIWAPFSHTKGTRAWRWVPHDSCVTCSFCCCFSGTLLRMQGSPFRLRAGLRAFHQWFSVYYTPQGAERGTGLIESQDSQKAVTVSALEFLALSLVLFLAPRGTSLSIPCLASARARLTPDCCSIVVVVNVV